MSTGLDQCDLCQIKGRKGGAKSLKITECSKVSGTLRFCQAGEGNGNYWNLSPAVCEGMAFFHDGTDFPFQRCLVTVCVKCSM